MIKISEKFFLNLQKLEDYHILWHDDESIIIGTNFLTQVSIDLLGNIFQPQHNKKVDKTFPVFFLLTSLDGSKGLAKDFKKSKFPIKKLDKDLMIANVKDIKEELDQFVEESFGH